MTLQSTLAEKYRRTANQRPWARTEVDADGWLLAIRALADVPTMEEAGVPGYEAVQWYGFLAPAGTPPAIIAQIHAEAVKALHSAQMREKLAHDGAEPVGSSSEAFAAHIRNELDKWRKVAKAAGIQPQ